MNMSEVPYGYCHCGCGEKTALAKQSDAQRGYKKGQPVFFIVGHVARTQPTGESNSRWKGGRYTTSGGYVKIAQPGHPRADKDHYVAEHILIAERVLGKLIPVEVEVHHVNEIPYDNRNSNLVICQDHAYHSLLHQRQRALQTCGHAAWRKCVFCKQYDDPQRLVLRKSCSHHYHRSCMNKDRLRRYHAKRDPTTLSRKTTAAAGPGALVDHVRNES